ncbi:PhoD-like phosphatase [Lyngbya confervoides]|uniref:PhoD-like phosphatase n=1 Tax=Lyngbya confervoides BDU141951 TaxID=1574623 RepID=A0ABD4T0F4_9CYAN|nr:PhoD-like phosphatase [Lyngbya confervoides]MCM1981900.1 PhoD-like phosphatase [Lyngbya confervoides BDU141951]
MARKRYFGDRLAEIPFLLAGPILRQVNVTSVTVWFAARQGVAGTLSVYPTGDGGTKLGPPILLGYGQTIQVGSALYLCALTATGDDPLQAGQLYAYDLALDGNDVHVDSLAQYFTGSDSVSYFNHGLPTFVLPPREVKDLKIAHGSCRKPHGQGQDSLPLLDQLLARHAATPQDRVQQLFFTGDQIYGDDVADALLWVATDVGDMLLGWTEALPIQDRNADSQDEETVYESYALRPGVRSDIAEHQAGLTATLGKGEERANSHFFTFAEYLAAYLLVWSPALWPQQFPAKAEIRGQVRVIDRWSQDVEILQSFVAMLPQVRRALANVATYMICDDHDISDDWYLNREWCERVLAKPLGYRVVFNGLMAYALCQAWGNTPEQFLPGQPGEKLLAAIERWSNSHGEDQAAAQAIARYLGMPDQTVGEWFCRDQDVKILNRHPDALRWHFWVRSCGHEVLVLDTRTWRGYPEGKGIAPPMLLSPSAFEEQLERPLSQSANPPPLTFVVLPTNLVALTVVDWVQEWDWCRDRVFTHDVGDSWNFHEVAFTRLLLTLSRYRQRLIILSGDIHYSCAVQMQVWPQFGKALSHPQSQHQAPCTLVQLTSSAIKNAETSTHVIHTKLKSLLPEPSEDWLGWRSPPTLLEVVVQDGYSSRRVKSLPAEGPYWCPTQRFWSSHGNDWIAWRLLPAPGSSPPDWRYRLRWLRRQAAVTTPFQLPERPQVSSLSWIWSNRWFQEGPEVIGHNNFCQVSFQIEAGELRVVQDSYWLAPWHPGQVVSSRFCASIGNQTEQPLPSRDE